MLMLIGVAFPRLTRSQSLLLLQPHLYSFPPSNTFSIIAFPPFSVPYSVYILLHSIHCSISLLIVYSLTFLSLPFLTYPLIQSFISLATLFFNVSFSFWTFFLVILQPPYLTSPLSSPQNRPGNLLKN